MATKSTKTPEQRKAEVKALQETLAQGVETLRSSEEWKRYLNFAKGFHNYSFNNLMLIAIQRPDATAVAGYGAWQKKNRQVRKGEKGIKILAPSTYKVTETDKETGKDVEKTRIFFRTVSVFAFEQTDPTEKWVEPIEPCTLLEGEDETDSIRVLVNYLESIGSRVTFEKIAGGTNGYTDTNKNVTIDFTMSSKMQVKTLIHEIAHITLGHIEEISSYQEHRGTFEVEAESTAYIVAGALGIDSSDYSTGYVAGWMEQADSKVLKETASKVIKAAHTILEALEPTTEVAQAA